MTNKWLISKIYTQIQFNIKKKRTESKMAEDLNRYFSKKDIFISKGKKKISTGMSLVIQGQRICFLVQVTQVWSLVRELISHVPGGNKAHAPQHAQTDFLVCMLSVCCHKKHSQAQQSRFKTQSSQNLKKIMNK